MNERTTKNEYVIYVATWSKRVRKSTKPSLEETEPVYVETYRTTKTDNAYQVFIALSTIASLKQDSRQVVRLRLERHGFVVKELTV